MEWKSVKLNGVSISLYAKESSATFDFWTTDRRDVDSLRRKWFQHAVNV